MEVTVACPTVERVELIKSLCSPVEKRDPDICNAGTTVIAKLAEKSR